MDKAFIKKLSLNPNFILFTDIDGTLTHHGELSAQAFQSLYDLRKKGIQVIPVTGRPMGWCDAIVRQWPIKQIIGENGACALFFNENEKLQKFEHPNIIANNTEQLALIKNKILKSIPLARVAKDQPYRQYDLAIDFAEEPPVLPLEDVKKIKDIFIQAGAHAKISDIHVNGWLGNYDKLSMVEIFSEEVIKKSQPKTYAIYIGDSPNDEPFFQHFNTSIGVANIKAFTNELKAQPTFITKGFGGDGFFELAEILLS